MRLIKCEVCGGTNIVKAEGVFVCQNCGCKYTLEEAQKLMIDGPVEVHGKVSVEGIGTVDNILKLAKRYEDNKEYNKAIQFYQKALEIDSNNSNATCGLERLENAVQVEISRKEQPISGLGQKVVITVDGNQIDALKNGASVTCMLKPGTHSILAEGYFWKPIIGYVHTSTLSGNIEVEPNMPVNIACWINFSGKLEGEFK